MPSNETNSATNPGRKLITLATTAAISVIAIILLGAMTAQAQSGAVPNLELSSASPGALTISWDAPDPAPSDYRIIWAKQDLDFPSYKAASRGCLTRGTSGSRPSPAAPRWAATSIWKIAVI